MIDRPDTESVGSPPIPFELPSRLRGANAQTLLAYLFSDAGALHHTRTSRLDLAGGDEGILLEDRPTPPLSPIGCAVLVHGLGGHGDSRYCVRIARKLVDTGWRAVRFSMRGTGPDKLRSSKLYNAGASDDLATAVSRAAGGSPDLPVCLVGFSLGANVVLKYLAEGRGDLPANLAGGIAVNPPIDLERCVEAISRRRNLLYDQNFVALLKAQMRDRRGALADPALLRPWRPMTLRGFDELVTAPLGGFDDAAHYYRESSSRPLLGGLRRDAVILASDDDPFIPVEVFDGLPTERLSLHITRGGGHMGFLNATRTPLGDRRWMDYAVLWYLNRIAEAGET